MRLKLLLPLLLLMPLQAVQAGLFENNKQEATRLFNPAPVLEWNLRKDYLADLDRRGVPTVPTRWVDRSSPMDLASSSASAGSGSRPAASGKGVSNW